MSVKKVLAALLIIIVAIGGFVTGLYLLRERQDVGEQAAVPGGDAVVSFSPDTGNFSVGDTITTGVYFNTAGIPVSGVAIRIMYPFDGLTPAISVASITMNSTLLSTGDWTCPVQDSVQEGSNVVIEIACANNTASGYVANQDTMLAELALRIERAPETSPLTVRFDPAESVITRRSDNEDILLIPASTGTYYIEGVAGITETPVPTGVTSTLAPTRTSTLTPTRTATGTATPTTAALPDAGVGTPTIFGVGLGVVVIVAAALLAI